MDLEMLKWMVTVHLKKREQHLKLPVIAFTAYFLTKKCRQYYWTMGLQIVFQSLFTRIHFTKKIFKCLS